MFTGSLQDSAGMEKLPPIIQKALRFLLETDLDMLAVGEIELEGRDLFVQVQQRDTILPSASLPEAHDRYLDIHQVISGKEVLGYLPRSTAGPVVENYLEEKDICFFAPSPKMDLLSLEGSDFVIFYPEDVHQPCLADGIPKPIKKVVVKVAMSRIDHEKRSSL
jgi:YhcH/YjgK/YiaL family protein